MNEPPSPRVIAGRMRVQNRRIVGHLARARPGWAGVLAEEEHEVLARQGHFGSNPQELNWRAPLSILAHLRDHAVWTYTSVQRIRFEDVPLILPFEVGDPLDCRRLTHATANALDGQVRGAIALVSATAATVMEAEASRHGEIAGLGSRTVQQVLLEGVEHRDDHLAQLDALQGRGL